MASRRLTLVVVVRDRAVHFKCLLFLRRLESAGRLAVAFPAMDVLIVQYESLEQAHAALARHLGGNSPRAAILISDLLAQRVPGRRPRWEPTAAAKDIADDFSACHFASIALLREKTRVPEIDHSLHQDFKISELAQSLQLAGEKIGYISLPERRDLVHPIVIREIRRQGEMRDYFKLRYRVYGAMGYLEERVQENDAELEMDWCDTRAIHIGAFEAKGRQQRLVGSARVVNAGGLEVAVRDLPRQIAERDSGLLQLIERTRLSLKLPIFHSVSSSEMDQILIDVEEHEKNCGELSRVIVQKDYRGAGLAHLLVKFAVFKANQRGIDPLLLECLEIHVPFYEKFGFRRVPGESGRVVGVQKTMVAMILTPVATESFVRGAHIFSRFGRLCACSHRECFSGEAHYHLAGTPDCPLE